MPGTPLYTIIVRGRAAIFELSDSLFQQALKEIEAKRAERDNKYQVFLVEDLHKPGHPVPGYAVYLDQDQYFIYEPGRPRQIRLMNPDYPREEPYYEYKHIFESPSFKEDLNKPNIKTAILDFSLGVPRSSIIQKYVSPYKWAHHADSEIVQDVSYHTNSGFPRTVSIGIKGPDKKLRDTKLKIDELSMIAMDEKDHKNKNVEFYRYIATEENGQITLKMDVAQNTPAARAGLDILKRYATNLLSALGINEQDKQRYPKVEVTGEGTKALYKERSKSFNDGIGHGAWWLFILLGGIALLAIGLINPIAWLLVGCGLLTTIMGGGGLIYQIKKDILPSKRDALWHENDLAKQYKQDFSNRKHDRIEQEPSTTTARVETPLQTGAGPDITSPASVSTTVMPPGLPSSDATGQKLRKQ